MPFRLYVQMNLVFIFIIIVMLHTLLRPGRSNRRYHLFAELLLGCIGAFVLDMFWAYVALRYRNVYPWFKFLVYALYFLSLYIIGFLWFRYSDFILGSPLLRGQHRTFYAALPLIAMAAILLTSYWTHLVIYVDAYGAYRRGPLYMLHPLFMCGYMLVAGEQTLRAASVKRADLFPHEYVGMLIFGIYPFTAMAIQLLFPSVPIVCAGILIGVVRVFSDIMERQISVDELTKLNNRNRLVVYFESRVKHLAHSGKLMYLLLIDVDHFKAINDRYGHNAGDRALLDVAEHLRQLGRRYPCFLARYGGDEFVILLETDDPQMLDDLICDLRSLSAPAASRQGRPYAISLSIGHAQYTPQTATLNRLLNIADQNMYAEKKRKRETCGR